MSEFKPEQGQISDVQQKAGKLDKLTGKKTAEQLEKELQEKHGVFFDKVDQTQTVLVQAAKLQNPDAIAAIDKSKTEIKTLLDQAAKSGEDILSKKSENPDFSTIRQSADRITQLSAKIPEDIQFFETLDTAKNTYEKVCVPQIQIVDELRAKGENLTPEDRTNYEIALKAALTYLGEDGVMNLFEKYPVPPSAEYQQIYDSVKNPINQSISKITDYRKHYLEQYEYDTEEKKKNMPEDVRWFLNIREGRGDANSAYGLGLSGTHSALESGKIYLESARKMTDETQQKSELENAKKSFVEAKTSSLNMTSALAEIDQSKLPDDILAMYRITVASCQSMAAESTSQIKQIEKGMEFADGDQHKAIVDAQEKEYSDGDDSAQKNYETSMQLKKDMLDAKDLDLNNPQIGSVSQKALSKLAAIKGKLASVDRAALPSEYQLKFDALSGKVNSQLQDMAQVRVMIEQNMMVSKFVDENKSPYFTIGRKKVGEQMVVDIQPTEEFKKLPKDKKDGMLRQFASIPAGIAVEITREMDLPEDKDWNDAIAQFESGNWQAAKPTLLNYFHKYAGDPEKAIQVASAKGMLQGIMNREFSDAKENLYLMQGIREHRGDITGDNGSVQWQQLEVSIGAQWDRMDKAQAIVESGKCLTIEEVWEKVGKSTGVDLAVNGISFIRPEDQQKLLSEPDPEKRRANILQLARAAKKAGMTEFAKKYYEMYFNEQIETKKKTISREQIAFAFDHNPNADSIIGSAIDTVHDKARGEFIQEYHRKHVGDDKDAIDQWEENYKTAHPKIASRMRDMIIDQEWRQQAKKALHYDYFPHTETTYTGGSSASGGGSLTDFAPTAEKFTADKAWEVDPSGDPNAQIWQEAYGGTFGVAENINNETFVFTDDELRGLAANIAVGAFYAEIALAAGVLTGGLAADFMVGEIGTGAFIANSPALTGFATNFVVQNLVTYSTLGALREGKAAFAPGKFLKGLALTYLISGVLEGVNYEYQGFKMARALKEGPKEVVAVTTNGGFQGIVAIDDLALNVAALTGKSAFNIGFDLATLDKSSILIPAH